MIVSNAVIHDPRVLKEASALRAAGHYTSISGWDRASSHPPEEEYEGLRIRRVRTRGLMRLLVKDLFRNPIWWRRAYEVARTTPFDVVHCHDLDTLPIGTRLKHATGRPLVYDCHEVFYRMIEREVPRFVTNYVAGLEKRLTPGADRIVTVSGVVADYLREISGRESLVVANYPDFIVPEYRPPPAGPFTVLYLGHLHASRFILPAIDIVGAMPDAKIVVAGGGGSASAGGAKGAGDPNATLLRTVPHNRNRPLFPEFHHVRSMCDPQV